MDIDENIIKQISSANKLLIVAAAGLSISIDEPNNVYHSKDDFKFHYPQVVKYGYSTAYEAMSLARDENVPIEIRKAYAFRHFSNMRFDFKPPEGYKWLKQLADSFLPGNTFVWTSNVDGCFERSGFDPSQVYTTQGEMNKLQCARTGCGNVWNCEEQMRIINAASPNGILTDMSLLPVCSLCGSKDTFPNLRGGDWFIHSPYKEVSVRLMNWLDACIEDRANIAIIEVGVGPNTPIVTRIPACAFANAVHANGGNVMYLRINPDRPEGRDENPLSEVKFFRWRQSWTALHPLVERVLPLRQNASDKYYVHTEDSALDIDNEEVDFWKKRYKKILESLDTPRR